MKKILLYILVCPVLISFFSCGESVSTEHKTPIILGDSSMIVTETDPAYLENSVLDLQHRTIIPEASPEENTAAEDNIPAINIPVSNSDFQIDFGDVLVVITGIETKEYLNQDPKNAKGVSYAKTEGELSKSKLILKNATNIKVRQRYQSELILKNGDEELYLKNLGMHTSEWEVLEPENQSANQFSYDLSTVYEIDYKKVSQSGLRNAVQKELKRRRRSNAVVQSWLKSIQNVKSPTDKPFEIRLHNLQWQISGTNADGQNFFKTIRLED